MGSASVDFSYDAQWRMHNGGSWSFSWTNDTGSPIKINSVSIILGTGNTNGYTIWSSTGKTGPFSGDPIIITMTMSPDNGASASGITVSSKVSMASAGTSTSNTGYFNNAYQSYGFGFSQSSNLGAGATVTFSASVTSTSCIGVIGRTGVQGSGITTATISYSVASHTVTFIDGLTGGVVATTVVNDGGSASLPIAPSHTGYTCVSWSGTYTNVTSDTTVTANYVLTPYSITFNGQSGSVSPTSITVYYNNAVGSLPTPSRAAYNFNGWFTGGGGSGSQYTSSTVYPYTGNITLYAYWTPITYTISYIANDATSSPAIMPSNPTTYNVITSTFVINNPSRKGYTFWGWTGNGAATPTTYMVVYYGTYGNIELTANWVPQLEKDTNGAWGRNAVPYRFNGSSWTAVDAMRYDGSNWSKYPN